MDNRNKFKGVNSIKFNRYFQGDDNCYRYLSEVKWSVANSYRSKKYGYLKYSKGNKPFSRRCTKCNYDESPTAVTMFDKLKFSLLVAFHIVFKISTKKKGMSSLELSEEFELRQKTCWEFKWKIQQAMASSKRFPLIGEVHVDEFLIGEYEEGKQGRSSDSKKRLVVMILDQHKIGGAYARVIEHASAKEFKPFFEAFINKDSKVVTDQWKGYLPLKKEYPLLKQVPSSKGAYFKQLHKHQGWLRGIHHHCTKERLQGYLDGYHYRYNRRNNMDTIFDLTIKRMALVNLKTEPIIIKHSDLKVYTKNFIQQ